LRLEMEWIMEQSDLRIVDSEIRVGDVVSYTYDGTTTYAKVVEIRPGIGGRRTVISVLQCDENGNSRLTSREDWPIPDKNVKMHRRSK
jgi:hypothetical protein